MRKYRVKIAGDGTLFYRTKSARAKALVKLHSEGYKTRPLLEFRHGKTRRTPRGIYHAEGSRKMAGLEKSVKSGFGFVASKAGKVRERGERFEAARMRGEVTSQDEGWLN
jgi:hypothetical protein